MLDVKDEARVDECPVDCIYVDCIYVDCIYVDCIYEGERMLYTHPDECVECGSCEPVCPVEAIFCEDDVPEQWTQFTAGNASFFDPLGSPGGASKTGPLPYDTDYAASCVTSR